jgi:hypothetical protein
MPDLFRLVYPDSPFLPVFDHDGLVKRVIQDLIIGHKHAAAIAMATSPLMDVHASLLRVEQAIVATQHLTEADLQMLTLGYIYPIETILASAICLPLASDEWPTTFEELLVATHNFNLLRLQDQMLKDLRATINLLKMDPSGALVFDFLKKYPFSHDECFLSGMEIAAMIFFGLSLEVAEKTGDDSWLTKPYDPTIT